MTFRPSHRLFQVLTGCALSVLVCTTVSCSWASVESIAQRLNVLRYIGLSEPNLVRQLKADKVAWIKNEIDKENPKDLIKYVASSHGFALLCMNGYVMEANLHAPDGDKKGYAGLMPKALSWGDTLSVIKTKLGKPQHEEDVADHDAYYVGYEAKGRRFILILNRSEPRKLHGIRIQARPIDEP